MDTLKIRIDNLTDSQAMDIVGTADRNLNVLGECLNCEISYRDQVFFLRSAQPQTEQKARAVLKALQKLSDQRRSVTEQDVIYACRLAERGEDIFFADFSSQVVGRTLSGKVITPKTRGQAAFVEAMEKYPVVFAIGPAGTGKTYLAVIRAVTAMKKGDVKRIVLTRPAVEAGENLGFLPGDLKEKVDPYLTPLYDALHVMLGGEQTEKLIEKGAIEIAPLAYMRGRTLDDAYVILDEAQNTTVPQMKMFMTRLGFRSKMIITGDITQIDLDRHTLSGLIHASDILRGIPEISMVELSSDDIVRHPLVQKIIERYEEYGERPERK